MELSDFETAPVRKRTAGLKSKGLKMSVGGLMKKFVTGFNPYK
jgi:hypothetical protein